MSISRPAARLPVLFSRFLASCLCLSLLIFFPAPGTHRTRAQVPGPARMPGADGPGALLISEFLANPAAVGDSAGEWVEIHNPGSDPVDLLGWTLADLDSDRHTIAASVVVTPGGFVVLARNGDTTANGGVGAAYVYGGAVQLANSADELLLLDANATEVDRVIWGAGTDLAVTSGASLERLDLGGRAGKAQESISATWATATTPWPGSLGDLGSPGQPNGINSPPTQTPSPTITLTPSLTPTLTPSATVTPSPLPGGNDTPTPTPSVTQSVTPSSTPSPTPSSTPTPSTTASPTATPAGDPPWLVISEFLANPAAVGDSDGEWLEIHNPSPDPANLLGWILADAGTDRHVIAGDLPVPPGRYVILARNADPAANGGVRPDYVISGGLQLANSADELLLLAPDGTLVNRVDWGGETGLTISAGASLEWTDFTDPQAWTTAHSPWSGSAGDLGSPGQPYAPPPDVTSTPTPTPSATPPSRWQPAEGPSLLHLDEIYFRSADGEFIVIHNRGDAPVDLTGWAVGDAEFPGDGEGIHALPDGEILAPDARFVIARDGAAFRARWGRPPNAQIQPTDPDVPGLARRTDLASGSLALNDSGDEVVLLTPSGRVADALAYGNGDYAALGLAGELRPPGGAGLHRVPGPDFPAQPDGRSRYLYAPPDPFAPLADLPAANPIHPDLDAGLRAVWGTLAARSTFSSGGTAPPGYLLAAAHSQGLDFVAFADPPIQTGEPGRIWTWPAQSGSALVVESWGWGAAPSAVDAVVYGASVPGDPMNWDGAALLAHVHAQDRAAVQWLADEIPNHPRVAAIAGDDVAASGGWTGLARRWADAGAAWLPAGNSNPALPGELDPAPRFTGLAVAGVDESSVLAALSARRGWLTNRPGLWLTLAAEPGTGQSPGRAWMGTVLPPVAQLAAPLTFDIHYGDVAGQTAGLALWRNDRPIATLDTPPADGRWTPSVTLAAGVYYAVATQADGDFAVTAPIVIPQTPPTPVPAPTITPTPGPTRLPPTFGQAPGPPGSLAAAKLAGLDAVVRFRAQVVAPPGLYNASIYVAEPALGPGGPSGTGGLGIQIYLHRGDFPPLAEGDWVEVSGRLDSFRGELELILDSPDQIWRMAAGPPLAPLPIRPAQVGESLESRLVTLEGVITGWGWDSLYLAAQADVPVAESVRVTVRSSLPWQRPYVNLGEVWRVTGIVSQFAASAPWNGGYRILVRYESDLVRLP